MLRRGGRPGLIGTMARTAVVAGTATAVAKGVSNRMDRSAQEQQAQAAAGDDMAGKPQQLSDMRAQGMLTEQEFQMAKQQLMGNA